MSHGGQCLAVFFVKMSGLFWPVLCVWGPPVRAYRNPRAGLGGHEANMEELGYAGIAYVYGGYGNVWGRCLSMWNRPHV